MSKIISSDEQLKIKREITKIMMVERTSIDPDSGLKDEIKRLRSDVVNLLLEEIKK